MHDKIGGNSNGNLIYLATKITNPKFPMSSDLAPCEKKLGLFDAMSILAPLNFYFSFQSLVKLKFGLAFLIKIQKYP